MTCSSSSPEVSWVRHDDVEPFVAGLMGGIDAGEGPTGEQLNVLDSMVRHLWKRPGLDLKTVSPLGPQEFAAVPLGAETRRRFCEILMALELCRHPQSVDAVARIEEYASALGIDQPELSTTRTAMVHGADAAAKDLERFYDGILPEISETSLRDHYLRLDEPDHELAARLRALHELPEGTLGYEYVEFYRRNKITLPGDDVHLPAHYVNHDMNHVITGYEPIAPGEIARSGFLWAAKDTRANWLEFLLTLSIHESGVLTHGDIRAKVETLGREGVPELLGEGLARGARCTVDLPQVDHLALVELPLEEVRTTFNVVPREDPVVAG
jgi:ubiquinone biosynthesis protein Coq4